MFLFDIEHLFPNHRFFLNWVSRRDIRKRSVAQIDCAFVLESRDVDGGTGSVNGLSSLSYQNAVRRIIYNIYARLSVNIWRCDVANLYTV